MTFLPFEEDPGGQVCLKKSNIYQILLVHRDCEEWWEYLTLLCSSRGFSWVLGILLAKQNVPNTNSPWMSPLQGLGAAHAGSRCLVLRWRGIPKASLVLYGPAAKAGALGHGEQEQRVQQHLVSATGGEVQRHVPAAEGQVQSHGEGETLRFCYKLLRSL